MKVKSVLIVSYHSSLNCGDRALLEMNIRHLSEAFESPNISVAVNWPEEPYFQTASTFKVVKSAWSAIGIRAEKSIWRQLSGTFLGMQYAKLYRRGIRRGIPKKWKDVFDSYEQADVVASVSSTLFYSTGRFGWPFPVKTWTIELAHLFNKPFMVLPQSIGPLRWEWERKLLRNAYKKAFLILLRDKESLRLATRLRLPEERVRFAPDPTFIYDANPADDARSLLYKYGFAPADNAIGLTMIPWQGRWVDPKIMENYFDSLVGFINQFCASYDGRVYIFNQVTGPTRLDDDRVAINTLLQRITGYKDRIVHVDEILSPSMLKACYGQMKLVIATRMHSGIFSLGMGVPVLYLGYLQKTRGLMEWLGLQEWVIELENLDQDILLEQTARTLAENDYRKKIITSKLNQISAEINATPVLIRESFSKL